MKKVIYAITIALTLLLLPAASYAQSPPDPGQDWNIKIEYRYTAGEEDKLNIPTAITKYGRNYRLVDKQPAVLEKLLPAERTYTWHIDGVLTEEEKKSFEDIEGIVLTPINLAVQEQKDINETLYDLASNDVDALPQAKEGFSRAAVTFEVQENDEWGLPQFYKAEVLYRGVETVTKPGYYEVNSKYSTTESLDDVPLYVVVATYAPTQTPQIVGQTGSSGGTGNGADGGVGAEDGGAIIPPVDLASEAIPEQDVPLSNIPAGTVGSAETSKFSTYVPIILAVLFALVSLLILYREHLRRKAYEARREARKSEIKRAQGLVDFD